MDDRMLLLGGVTAGPLFTMTYLIAGAARADYMPLRHPVSSLALGPGGWTQTTNFLVAGLLSLGFSIGLWQTGPSRPGAVLIGVWAIGLVCAGLFRTDPVSGYPPGSPDQPHNATRAGAMHDLLSLVGFIALAASCFVFAWHGSAIWTVFSVASGAAFAATMVLASAAFAQSPQLVHLGGLIQRGSVTIAWTWLTVLALRVLCS